MKKKNITLLALIVILIVLFAANKIITSVIADNEAKKEAESESESEAARIFLSDLKDIANIKFNNGTTDLSFSYTKEGGWVYDPDSTCKLDQNLMNTFSQSLIQLESTRKLAEPDSLDSYGLDSPASSVTFTDSEGNSQTYYVGDTVNDKYCYMMTDKDKDSVYTVEPSWKSYLSYNINKFVKTVDVTDIWNSKETSIKVDNGKNTVELIKNGTSYTVSKDGGEAEVVTDTTAASTFTSAVSITPTACVNYKPSKEQLTKYGLDRPQYTITINYKDDSGTAQKLTIYIGNKDSSGSSIVYYTSEDKMVMNAADGCLDNLSKLFSLDYTKTVEETTATK